MADYAFKPLEDRQKIEKMWTDGRTTKEISAATGASIYVVYNELHRGQDGTRLPDNRLRYSAKLAQGRVQASLEKRGKRTGQPADSSQAAERDAANR